jgi:hypothetical protein
VMHYTYTPNKVMKQLLVRKDMNVNERERLSTLHVDTQ